MDGLKMSETEFVIYVHPSQSKKVPQALQHEMNSLLFKYNEALDGVVLAHDVESVSPDAKILSGVVPYFGVRLEATLLLFSPKKDMLLEGKVEKVSQNTINVIVLGLCSATITADDIRGEFDFKTVSICCLKNGKEICYSTRHKSHEIRAGTMLRFLVKSWDTETLIISGSMVPRHTGCIRWLELKRKQHGTSIRLLSQGSDVDLDSHLPPSKKHKSKVHDASSH